MSKPILAIDLFSQANLRCPHQAHQTLREAGRIVEVHGPNGSVELAIPHHEDVKTLLRSDRLSPSLFEGNPELIDYIAGTEMESFMENHFFSAAPEKHRRLRQATSAGFSPRVMEPFRAELRATIEETLAPLKERDRFDLASEVSMVLPTRIMQRLYHFPTEVMPLFLHLGEAMHQIHTPGAIKDKKHAVDVFNNILPRVYTLMDERRESPIKHDFLSVMLQEEIDTPRGKTQLSRDEASAAAIVLMFSAVNTSIDVLSFAVLDLLKFPEQRALALEDEQRLEGAVLEVIRREFPFPAGATRFAVEPFAFAGETIPQAQRLCVMTCAAMHDPTVYPEPERFDIERDQTGFLGFGYGPHYCVGSALAKMQVVELLRVFFRDFPSARLHGEPVFDTDAPNLRRIRSLSIATH